jgi:hypothetical protein
MMEQYQYEPLPSPNSIRLIKFRPGENCNDDNLACTFIVVDTSDPPQYIALSYVWGDVLNTVPISIDGKAVHITQNLRDVLQHFSVTPALLWADALCINQQDISEKNQQVNMMATIYRKAANVTVWLGPDEHNDAPAIFEDIKTLIEWCGMIIEAGGQFGHFDEESGDLHWQLENRQNYVSALPKSIVNPNEEERARLERFYKLPWFLRTWTLQEVGLAADAVVHWGNLAMEWNPVGLTAMFLRKALLRKLGLTTKIERVYHIYTAFSPFIPMTTFIHIINNVRRFKATDPRDKVFALLSHPTAHTISMTTISLNWDAFKPALPMAFHFLPSFQEQFLVKTIAEERATSYTPPSELPPPLLQADYNKTVDEVYRDLALDLIDRTMSLEILTTVQHDPGSTVNLFTPSWVPRWDYFIDTPTLGLYNSTHVASANKDAILTPPPPEHSKYPYCSWDTHHKNSQSYRSPRILVLRLAITHRYRRTRFSSRSRPVGDEPYSQDLALKSQGRRP